MAVVYGQRRTRKMANSVFLLNVFHLVCVCRASLDLQGQAFIQTDNELRYMIDTGAASSLHNSHDPNIPDVSVVRFDPPVLDFNEQPVGMPFMEQVTVQNLDTQTSLHLLSISGSTLHFHCSFFQDKLVPPLGNTTFEVVFLARQVGSVENTLYIHSSKASFKYQVFGVGLQNPYRVRPFLGARVPVNSSFSPLIRMYNPHGTILQVEEIYTSGGDLHLELPTGEREAPKDLWEIPPFETKSIMKASFLGRVEHNHTAFIRIKTNKDNKQEMLILPVEVEVTSAPGIYSPTEMLDFGILRTLDEPSVLRLSLINSGSKPIQITNITVQPPNSAVHIDFRPTQVRPDILHPTSVALISFTASLALLSKQWSGKIIIKSKNSQYKLTIPYQAHILHGSLVYDRNKTMFYTGESSAVNVTHDFSITNTFNFTVVIYNISIHPSIRSSFTITNFSQPCLIGSQQSLPIFNLTFHPNSSMLHLVSEIYLHTNASVFKIPLHVYNGRLKVIHHRPEIFKGQLDFGTMAVMEKRVMNFTLRNDNPVDIIISRFYSNMERTVVSLLGVEKGNGTILSANCNSSKLEMGSLILKPYHIAVFSVELTAPDHEGTFSAEVIISTQFEHLYMPMTLLTATGSLHLIPDKLVLTRCFPGKISSLDVRVRSTFPHQIKLRDIAFTPNDARFYYLPSKDKHLVLPPDQETVIGHLYFDPRRECKDDCYVTLPTHLPAGHTWLLGSTLDKEVTDTDQYLFTRFRQKWEHLETSQTSIVNVTLQLDTNQVRGFLFPAQANLHWPTIVKKPKIKFHLTQIGNASICEFVLENPTDIPVVVHVVPVALYPNAQTLINTIGPFLPSDVTQDYFELDDGDAFSLRCLTEGHNLHPVSGPSLVSMRRHVETTLGVRTNKSTLAFVLPSRTKIPIEVIFQPKDDVLRNSLFIIRNNLTIIETVFVQGQGGLGELRFSNRKPGSQKPLMFEMTDKHLKNCDKKMQSKNIHPNFTVKRTFTLRNTGQLPLYLHGFYIGNSPCEGYGFKILDCVALELPPNASHKVDIVFTPDFTMSRIRQVLTLHTSLGSAVNFSLQATIPTHMLTQCAAALPRPTWEPLLYYSVLLAMGFLLMCIALAAYFEAERLFTADLIKRRSELNQMAFDKSKVFDLKSIANFKLPSDPSKISSNLYMSRRLAGPPSVATPTNIGGHVETGKTPSGALHPHRRESWWSRILRKFSFWQSSTSTSGTVVNNVRQTTPDVAKYGSTTDGVAKSVGATTTIPVSNERTVGKTGIGKSLLKYLCELYVVWSGVKKIWKFFFPKRFASKSAKSTTRSAGDQGKEPNVSDPDANGDQGGVPSSSIPNTQKRNSDHEHQKRQLEVKSATANKEKSCSASQLVNLSTGNNTQTPVSDEPLPNKKEAQKNQKIRKAKAGDLKRANKKLLENEKMDKDDSSSTTTETSSIEADEKNASPRSQEIDDKSRTKKVRSKTRRKENVRPISPEDTTATPLTPPGVLDDFLSTATKQASKSSRKSKANQNQSLSPNSQKPSTPEQPSTVKHDSTAVAKENKPKQVCLPLIPPETTAASTTAAASRKKTNKAKTPGVGQACNSNRYFTDSYHSSSSSSPVVLWDMPRQGCEEHDGLSELAAQTDLFARTYNLQATAASKPTTHEPLLTQPNHSSYSSVVSNAVRVTDHHNHHPLAMSKATRLNLDGLLTTAEQPGAVDGLVNATRQQPNALISMPATGGMSGRPASSRPVAAVGATVRRTWPGNFNHSHSVPDDIASGMCQSGLGGEVELPLASGNRLLFDDPAIMAGFGLGLNQSCMPQEGYDLYGYGPSMMSNPLEHQQATLMQRLQAERRKRFLEYELKKHATGAEWPGFDLPTAMPPDPWEQPSLLSNNTWGPMPSTPLGGGVRPSSGPTGIWNMGAASSPDALRWMGNIWSSPEPETKLASSSPSDLAEEMGMNSSAGGATAGHGIFDPFNTLEIRTGSIWNPTSTGSGMTGWGFGGGNKPGDGNNMK